MLKGKKDSKNEFIAKNADTPLEVALYYGFKAIGSPTITKDDMAKARNLDHTTENNLEEDLKSRLILEQKIALTRIYLEKNMQNEPRPFLLYCRGPISREKQSSKKNPREVICNLEILGTDKSIAEAMLIETAVTILKEEGYKNILVEINNLGNRESASKFQRELVAYYRKHINSLPPNCRQMMKKNIWSLLSCLHEKCKELSVNSPQAVSFLNETERTHFKEILEFLETLEVPYRISNHLVGNRIFTTGPVFEIRTHEGESEENVRTLAFGSRHDEIAKKIGAKKDIPSAGITLTYQRIIKSKEHDSHQVKKPKVFFIQLGFNAKLKSLKVIEMLRQAKISVYQSLSRDKIGDQLSVSERMQTPFIMIMGQKEAIENSVIVRDMSTRSQETVSIENLPRYLKKLKD